MASCSDAGSDGEEFPVFDFLLPGGLIQAPQGRTEKVDLGGSDAEEAGRVGTRTGSAEVMMISSESEDDAPYVPLAQRLKQKQHNVISASAAPTNGKGTECRSASLTSSQLAPQNSFPQSECPLSFPKVSNGQKEGVAFLQQFQPPKLISSTGSISVSPAKRKPIRQKEEEVQISREEDLRKWQQQGGKEGRRLEQDRLKAERKALAEAAKAMSPKECIKHLVVAVDPALLQVEEGGTLLAALQALGCSCAVEKQPIPRSVSWVRRAPSAQPDEVVCVPEAHVVMHMTVDDFITLTHNYIQEERYGGCGSGPTLTSWMQEQQRRNPDKSLSLVIIDLEKYFRSQKSQSQKRFREEVAGEEQEKGKVRKRKKNVDAEVKPKVSRVEVEEALVHLQLHTNVLVRFLMTWKDFTDHIATTTKAVAELPFKRERAKTSYSFYLESKWAGGQKVDKAGNGLLQVWKRQIQQLNRVSPDMASAILAAYPSPQLLKQAYKLCKTEQEKMSLLSDLLIRRGEGVASTTRRVGPELSKRLFLLMNSCDPDTALDSSA